MIGTRTLEGIFTEMARPQLRFVSAPTLASWTGYLLLASIVTAAVVESLLVVRLWAQLTSQDIASGLLSRAYSLSGELVAPFQQYEGTTPIRTSGILELATLTAIEVYLIGALVTVATLFILKQVLHLVARRQARHQREAAFGNETALASQAASAR